MRLLYFHEIGPETGGRFPALPLVFTRYKQRYIERTVHMDRYALQRISARILWVPQAELELERAVGHAPTALEQSDRLVEDLPQVASKDRL